MSTYNEVSGVWIKSAAEELTALRAQLAEAVRERDEAKQQAKLGWERHAEKDRSYGDALSERDQWRGVATRLAESLRDLHDRSNALADFDKLNAQ
jgi:hypothetical protein